MRETEVEDASLGTVTPADFGFTIRGFTVDIGICCLRSVDRIPRLSSRAVKKDEYSIEAAADTLRERPLSSITSRSFLLHKACALLKGTTRPGYVHAKNNSKLI